MRKWTIEPSVPVKATVKRREVIRAIDRYFTHKNKDRVKAGYKVSKTQELLRQQLLTVVDMLIIPQVKDIDRSMALFITDRSIMKVLPITKRRARQLRQTLREAGVIYVPELPKTFGPDAGKGTYKAKTNGPGTYTLWLLEKRFIVWSDSQSKKATKRPRGSMIGKLSPTGLRLYDEVLNEVHNDLDYLTAERDSTEVLPFWVYRSMIGQHWASKVKTMERKSNFSEDMLFMD